MFPESRGVATCLATSVPVQHRTLAALPLACDLAGYRIESAWLIPALFFRLRFFGLFLQAAKGETLK
jgi:hypothetical protein